MGIMGYNIPHTMSKVCHETFRSQGCYICSTGNLSMCDIKEAFEYSYYIELYEFCTKINLTEAPPSPPPEFYVMYASFDFATHHNTAKFLTKKL